jgi:hypothetical protein
MTVKMLLSVPAFQVNVKAGIFLSLHRTFADVPQAREFCQLLQW